MGASLEAGCHTWHDRGQLKPDQSSTDRILKGRQLAEAQDWLKWFTVLLIPAKWSIGGVLGLSDIF